MKEEREIVLLLNDAYWPKVPVSLIAAAANKIQKTTDFRGSTKKDIISEFVYFLLGDSAKCKRKYILKQSPPSGLLKTSPLNSIKYFIRTMDEIQQTFEQAEAQAKHQLKNFALTISLDDRIKNNTLSNAPKED